MNIEAERCFFSFSARRLQLEMLSNDKYTIETSTKMLLTSLLSREKEARHFCVG